MAAPTVTFIGASNATDTGATETVAGVTWNAGDRVLVLGMTADQNHTFALPAATGLTFTALTNLPSTTSSSCKGYGWQATPGSSGSATLTVARTGGATSNAVVAVWVITGSTSTGIGTPAVATNTAKTNSLVRGGTDSAVVWIAGDWSASTDVTVTSSPGGATQRVAATLTGESTLFCFEWGGQGAAGTTSYGIANASGTGELTKVAVEILGATSADGSASSPVADAVATSPAQAIAAGSSTTAPATGAAGASPAGSVAAGSSVSSPAPDALGAAPVPAASGASWEDIDDATASTLLLDSELEGDLIRCVVTATNAAGSDTAPSNETGPVEASGDAGATAPAASALGDAPAPTVTAGSTTTPPAATALGAAPAPAVSGNEWEDISGATASTYEPEEGDVDYTLRCVVTASNSAGDSDPEPSNEVGPVEAADESADATVTAPAADATGQSPAPASIVSVDVTTGPASATGDAPVPAVTGATNQTASTPAADALGAAQAPAVTGSSSPTTPAADATGTAPIPAVTGSSAGEVNPPAADAAGASPAPTVHAGQTVAAPAADATGRAPAPFTGEQAPIPPLVAIGDYSAAVFRDTGRTHLPAAQMPATSIPAALTPTTSVPAVASAETELVTA